MTYSQLLGEYKPTLYRDPLSCGKRPHKLADGELQRVIETCFTKASVKQGYLLKRISDATNASVGIKTHEARQVGHGCTYNNIPDRVAAINKKLKRYGYPFEIWPAKPANKKSTDDSWLWWVVTSTNTQTTHSKGVE